MRSNIQLERAEWTADDTIITLWHGKEVPVRRGDTVYFYDTKSQLLFVEVRSVDNQDEK